MPHYRVGRSVAMLGGLVLTAVLALGCTGDADDAAEESPTALAVSTATSIPESTATTEVVTTPASMTSTPMSSSVSPTETSTATPEPAVTDAELVAIAEALFPDVGGGIYVACDNRVDLECPLSDRLAQLVENTEAQLCRCQNASDSREIAVLPDRLDDGGGIVRVTMYQGSTSYDLLVVQGESGWVLDDIYCAGRPETSIHQAYGPC